MGKIYQKKICYERIQKNIYFKYLFNENCLINYKVAFNKEKYTLNDKVNVVVYLLKFL